MSVALEQRIDALERKLRALHRELEDVRTIARAERAPQSVPAVRPPQPRPRPPARPVHEPAPSMPPLPSRPPRAQLDYGKLLSAASLAWAGGIVTLLGIVFLFVLASERGWIGPEARVAFGGMVSVLLVAVAVLLHRRHGRLHSALGAAGAGIAGAYATLLAATALYSLIPDTAALALAAVVSSIGVVLALRWSSQLIAGIGLVGAILVPAVEAFDGGISIVGTAFAAFMTAGALAVGAVRDWRLVGALAAIAGGLQGAALVLVARDDPSHSAIAVAAGFAFVFAAGGIGWTVRRPRVALGGLPTSLVLVSGGFVLYSGVLLFDRLDQGIALLVAGAVYAAATAWLFRVSAYRDLSALLLAMALTAGGVGLATLLSGPTLTFVWAGEAVILFWLAPRAREIRFQVAGLVYLTLAAAHALTTEARPEVLFTVTSAPETAIPSIVALAVACGACAFWARPWLGTRSGERGVFALFAPLLQALHEHQSRLRVALATSGSLFALYALAVGILAVVTALGGSFDSAHAVISGVWGAAGVCLLATALRRGARAVRIASLWWLAVTASKVLVFDVPYLAPEPRSASLLAVAASLFAAGVLLETLRQRGTSLDLDAAVAVVAGLGLALGGVCSLFDGTARGFGLLVIAVAYGSAAAALLRQRRDFGTLLSGIALGVGAASAAELLAGQWLVLVYAAGGAALAWLAVVVREPRFQVAALAYLGGGLMTLVADAAPPDRFFTAGSDPGSGVPAVLALAAAVAAAALACRRLPARDGFDAVLERVQPGLRRFLTWVAGALGLYGVSLALLELFELTRPGTLESSFQSGHTTVSAAWGLLGLVLLYLGLRRANRPLQLGGFALFGLSLGKLFLYDLANLSSVTRALSFLAVGAVLLLAGFFYQRLTRRGSGRPAAS